ncbi:MAG TPA: cell envelope integrity protein TolA [Chthoniobacterales bacterium]|nr:cell envelope integrity protein TolA [Chthoniobacterales bacterium]
MNRTRAEAFVLLFAGTVQLFEILQDGFHTPLNATQIAELFNAGRLGRHTPCKPAKQTQWRTVDELFPLLKYHTAWEFEDQPQSSNSEFRCRRSIVLAMGLVAAAAAIVVIYLFSQRESPLDQRITAIHSPAISATPARVRRAPVPSTRRIRNTTSAPNTASLSNAAANPVVVRGEEPDRQAYVRSAESNRIAEQARREQAKAQVRREHQLEAARQQRLLEEQKQKLLEEQKAAGRDEHVPLDQWQIVNVGGESVAVKIHDNNISTFDVSINYGSRREVKKEKGISHSQTDETLLYSNGRASLYYVWEISGRINHCLLRVRDA